MPSPLEATLPPGGVPLRQWCHSRAPPRLSRICVQRSSSTTYSGLYRSDGAYGSGYANFYFLTPSSAFAYYQFMFILDLNNTHNSSGNRVAVMVYDDDNYTFLETLGTIDGSGGNICNTQYYFNVYRPGWANKHLHLTIAPYFSDSDANSKISGFSLNAYDHQVW